MAHDKIGSDGSYHRKCQDNCDKCKESYDKWCKENSNIECKKRSYTITEFVCSKVTVQKYGHKEREDHPWKKTSDQEPPRHCDKCGKKKCKCNKH